MKTVSKGRLKAKMLAYFREVEATGEPLLVTDHGRETLEVRPIAAKLNSTNPFLEAYRAADGKGMVQFPKEADLLEPVAEGDWEALKNTGDETW